MMSRLLIPFLAAIVVSPLLRAGERVLFSDTIENRVEGESYRKSGDVEVLQDFGGPQDIQILKPPLVASDTLALEFNSGQHNEATVLFVPGTHEKSERYGQIYIQLVRTNPECSWLEIALLGPGGISDKAIALKWDPVGEFRYQKRDLEKQTALPYPTDHVHTVTINYDILNASYSVWLDENVILDALPFSEDQIVEQGPTGIALSATWWGPPGVASYITHWGWSASDQPFESPYKGK